MKRKPVEKTIDILKVERDKVQQEKNELEAKTEWARGDGNRMAVLSRQIVVLDDAIQRLESYIITR